MSKVYSIKAVQKIPVDISVAWSFFSNPRNLQNITPPDVDFKVISEYVDDSMYPGQVIEYRLKPLWGIPFYWMTEITHVRDKKFFVDEERFGPYSFWHHQHHFTVIEGGVEMTDIVHYKVAGWFLGDVLNSLIIRKQLRKIFSFRFKATEERFGNWPGQTENIAIS
ncbi:MAG TPA: SRPBCC family protein [Chitinophagaceae bacterium]|nr:SRPBCC family protein [Chitinophagaceae bacterium]